MRIPHSPCRINAWPGYSWAEIRDPELPSGCELANKGEHDGKERKKLSTKVHPPVTKSPGAGVS